MTFPGHEENIHWGAMSENIMRIIDLRGKNLSRAELLAAMPRAAMGTSEATDLVRPILDDVKARGAAALRDFGEKFDGVRPTHLRVPAEAMKNALETLDPEVRAAIEESVRRARAVAKSQVPKDFYTDLADGARVAERWVPIQRVGLYVPGGKAVYPSSVIMNTVPAQAAGVESLAIATPPSKGDPDGLPNKTILATCAILGVEEVYAVGGAQAIAMFAYGAKGSEPQDGEILCDPVDKITGPGNIFVATAKSLVSGFVGIDAVAGPTEIGIIADKTANPSLLAADLIGQAEHDELAGSVLFTDSTDIADKVQENLNYRVPRTEHAERRPVHRCGQCLRGRALGDSDRRCGRRGAAHQERRSHLPRTVFPGSAGRLHVRLEPRAAYRWHCALRRRSWRAHLHEARRSHRI